MAKTRIETFSKKEMLSFLKAVDAELKENFGIILIGGAAAILAFGNTRSSLDIDTYNNIDRLEKAIERAKEKSGLNIGLTRSAVAFGPRDFEERLQVYSETKFRHLRVSIPEVHDFVMMKLTRLIQRDLDDIVEIHQKIPLNAEVLLNLFRDEMSEYIGSGKLLDEKYFTVIELLFGSKTLIAHRSKLHV